MPRTTRRAVAVAGGLSSLAPTPALGAQIVFIARRFLLARFPTGHRATFCRYSRGRCRRVDRLCRRGHFAVYDAVLRDWLSPVASLVYCLGRVRLQLPAPSPPHRALATRVCVLISMCGLPCHFRVCSAWRHTADFSARLALIPARAGCFRWLMLVAAMPHALDARCLAGYYCHFAGPASWFGK